MTRLFAVAVVAAAFIATSGTAAPAPDGKNRKILIQNNSSRTLRELYASPQTSTTWEEDLLGTKTLPPGKSISANIDNGTNECYYDLKAVFDSGSAIDQRKINVCAVGRWLITDTSNSFDSGGQSSAQPTPAAFSPSDEKSGPHDAAPAKPSPRGAAAPRMVRPQDPQSVVNAMVANGYPAELTTDKVGDPMIRSKVAGTTFQIFFYNCTDHKNCATVQFHSGYDFQTPPSLELMNEWNRTQRFGRGFLDKENDPIIEMDVDLDDGGEAPLLFIDNLEFWQSILTRFEKHIGYRQ